MGQSALSDGEKSLPKSVGLTTLRCLRCFAKGNLVNIPEPDLGELLLLFIARVYAVTQTHMEMFPKVLGRVVSSC